MTGIVRSSKLEVLIEDPKGIQWHPVIASIDETSLNLYPADDCIDFSSAEVAWEKSTMAGFIMKQVVGNKLNEVTGALGGGDDGGEKAAVEDPEVVAARQEMEEKRKEKHRKMEMEREKMRTDIRNKYNIHKKEENTGSSQIGFEDGRLGSMKKKTPEELAAEMQANDNTLIGQLGLTEQVETAKKAMNNAFESVKGFLPFGK